MILTGRIISWALIIMGGMRVGMGILVAQAYEDRAELAQYFGIATSGEAIDKGLMWIATGVAFGLLALIASNSSEKSTRG